MKKIRRLLPVSDCLHWERLCWSCILTTLLFTSSANSQQSYSPYANQSFPTNVFWGDTHVHTTLSADGRAYGNRLLTPEDAYRFAKGQEVVGQNSMSAKLNRPLDFLVVADHAENLNLVWMLENSKEKDWNTDEGRELYADFKFAQIRPNDIEANRKSLFHIWKREYVSQEKRKVLWAEIAATADRYNNPGKFTAFSGYEWTSDGLAERYGNLHRVVIFKDDAEKVSQVLPFSGFDSKDPEDLWKYLETYEEKTGGAALAIPHNSNRSKGEMFALTDFHDRPFTRDYAEKRARWEPLLEVTQMKGDSETHPILSPNDEFADFQRWYPWSGMTVEGENAGGGVERRLASAYARSSLKLGLNEQHKIGVNPFKFGMIGSTDAHTSLSTADDDNFWGKTSPNEPGQHRMFRPMVDIKADFSEGPKTWQLGAAGYAGLWAEENTRESLYAAMKRREVYASTGPRISIRFFGGWDYDEDDAFQPDLARIGYSKGVPMGGDLTAAPKGKAAKFLIRAVKDPDGANLDRVQVIKGWRSAEGGLHERAYDVALSDERKVRSNKRSKPIGSTVNIKEASYTNTIGDPELAVVWEDPDFNANELAFYYVRVIEIPTPRWTAYDAKRFNIPRENIPEYVPMVTQERAYTSPIWYSPN